MWRFSFIAAFFVMAFPLSGKAGEDYFVLMFGAQQVPPNPDYAHTFATFVRVTWDGDGPCPQNPRLEAHTISWLPSNMKVRTLALLPECGANFDLHTTLRFCEDNCMRVSLWGPYRSCPELYCWALKQKAHLESGAVRYKAIDSARDTSRVTNCIHAVADVVEGSRIRIGSPGFGETASYVVLKRYEPYIVHAGCTHPWVGSALGLDQHPIIYRDWQRPNSGLFGSVFRMLGGERDLQATYGPPR